MPEMAIEGNRPMIYFIRCYCGYNIYYDEYWDEYFIVGYPFNENYGYYYIEDALDEIDYYLWGYC